MKSYTDISQSHKLAEILPIESADMHYATWAILDGEFIVSTNQGSTIEDLQEDYGNQIIPCWSLAALLNLCPTINGKQPILTRGKLTRLWYCYYEDEMDTQTYDNPVDACVEMIVKLHELNLL